MSNENDFNGYASVDDETAVNQSNQSYPNNPQYDSQFNQQYYDQDNSETYVQNGSQDVNNVNSEVEQNQNEPMSDESVSNESMSADSDTKVQQKIRKKINKKSKDECNVQFEYYEEYAKKMWTPLKYGILLFISLFSGIAFFVYFKSFLVSPNLLLSLDFFKLMFSRVTSLLIGLGLFSIFLVSFTFMFFLSHNLILKLTSTLPAIILSLLFFSQGTVGLSFGISIVLVSIISVLYPPVKILRNHFTKVSSLQHFSSGVINKTLLFMFFIFIGFALINKTNYTDLTINSIMNDVNSTAVNSMLSDSTIRSIMAKTLSSNTGMNVSLNQVPESAVKLAKNQINDMVDSMKKQTIQFVYKIPYVNQITILILSSLAYFYLSALFALTKFFDFLLNVIFIHIIL